MDKSNRQIVVIGAGPAGLMAAFAAAKKYKSGVLLLEKNDSPAKKLLISGSGRCNITHAGPISGFLPHYGGKDRFVKPALFRFTNTDLTKWMQHRGLPLKELHDGKLFPVTESARDVLQILLNVLLTECSPLVEVRYRAAVKNVKRSENGFLIQTANEDFSAQNLVIATGGKSYPSTGSTGDGWNFARNLGHSIAEPAPALCPVTIRNYPFAGCAGLSFEKTRVQVQHHGKKTAENREDLLLTHRGFSGPVILDLSRYIHTGDTLRIAFTESEDTAFFERQFLERVAKTGRKTVKNLLASAYLPDRMTAVLLKYLNIPDDLAAANLGKAARKTLLRYLTDAPFIVEELGGYQEAMVTRGGVVLAEVNRNTMESRLVPGLFFCGEVLDIDGDTGGYNLQFAFSSGVLAGENLHLVLYGENS
ncbi:MAG: NAD(P)/FAD-dependent oxidoreductase [Planctomycetaceae bacterium]|nr:NAD(P)/FAD-dependent oxidoreductase [Planctomycetaceae bacterium]